jgi:hypothetical protein
MNALNIVTELERVIYIESLNINLKQCLIQKKLQETKKNLKKFMLVIVILKKK